MNIFAGLKGQAYRESAQRDPEHPANWQEDFNHENGQYQCRCVDCQIIFLGHKRRGMCKLCAQKTPTMGVNATELSCIGKKPTSVREFFDQWRVIASREKGLMLTREQLLENLQSEEMRGCLINPEAVIRQIKETVPEGCRLFPTAPPNMPEVSHKPMTLTVYFEYPLNKEQPS
jgi:hypothetical protein